MRVVNNFELACFADVSLYLWHALNRPQILDKRDNLPSTNVSLVFLPQNFLDDSVENKSRYSTQSMLSLTDL